MRTLAIINQKGGSGKTTTAINLAAAIAAAGHRTLLLDLDPQSHCALGLAVPESHIDLQIGDALLAPDHRINELGRMTWSVGRDLTLIPSTTKLAGIEASRGGLADRDDRDTRLASFLSRLQDQFDWCIADCPPFIGLLTFNAIRAATEVLIPVETAYFALQGAIKQVNTIRAIARRSGHGVAFRILPTLYDPQSPLAQDVLKELTRRFEPQLLPVSIRLDPRLREAASLGVPLAELDADSPGARDYASLGAILAGESRPPRIEPQAHLHPAAHPNCVALESNQSLEIAPGQAAEPPALSARERHAAPLTRAAELAARAKRLAARSAEINRKLDQDPEVRRVLRDLASDAPPTFQVPAQAPGPADISRFFGAHQTSRGVVFIQPGAAASRFCIAGDHNGWSAAATPMRFNADAGVHEACVPLPPGRFRYRIVVDGAWIADPHNPAGETNPYGDRDSVIVVEPRGIGALLAEVRHPVPQDAAPQL